MKKKLKVRLSKSVHEKNQEESKSGGNDSGSLDTEGGVVVHVPSFVALSTSVLFVSGDGHSGGGGLSIGGGGGGQGEDIAR